MGAGAVTRVWLVSSFWHIRAIVPFFSVFRKQAAEFTPSSLSSTATLSTLSDWFSTHLQGRFVCVENYYLYSALVFRLRDYGCGKLADPV